MSPHEAKSIIEALANSVDPETGKSSRHRVFSTTLKLFELFS
jgi:hypothetical protein